MPLSIRVANTAKRAAHLFVRDSNTGKRALRVWTRAGNAAKLAHSAFTPSVSMGSVDAIEFGGSGPLTTPPVTAAGLYGVGAVSYAWARIAGDIGITASAPASATTDFNGGVGTVFLLTATFRCTMTDAAGQVVTADVQVLINRETGA